ncbi:MAG: SDR family oxidoreductase [Candidatus Dormibacteraeota bacterium]|uniref:SDR family oxidoreductase n=1 Tax=Candidatus Amunia macphersoniae TaxID=3127014 RepID=A0A934KGW6_9BACT|nr:SDR family oxidoreductase [Candidatus Dormibacteraeota bacterium]
MSTGGPLQGRVAVVTGSSRGIGRVMALRLAAEGAAVVVTGKSEQSTDTLPGSIHSVAEEITAAGGRALPVRLDVRQEEEVAAMVQRTVDELGSLDILVNNAGALWWKPILETPLKRYDLMWDVNVRGSFACAQHALPHMIRNGFGHIVMCSPPIGTQPNPGYVAYMTTKMGMTRLAIGIAAEHESDNVACNSLWPVTLIESLATINYGVGDRSMWRSPEILSDALLEIVTSAPATLTGRQLLDEPFLRERGWSQERLDGYWLDGPPAHPVYIDGRAGSSM